MSAVIHGPTRRDAPDNRVLTYALLGSLVFHGVFLFGLSLHRESQRAAALPGPIAARLVEPQAPPATAPQPEPPKPRVEEPPPAPVVKPVPAPKPSPIAKAEPKTPTAKPAPVAPAPAAPSAEIAPAAPAPSAPTAPGPLVKAEPQPTAPAPSEQDSGSLAQYRRDVMRMALRYKRYPRVALDNSWEGTAVVRVIIGANGMIASISVISSSGHDVLDQQALDMIQKAKGGVPIPPVLRGKEFPIEIPVIYNVKDQGAG